MAHPSPLILPISGGPLCVDYDPDLLVSIMALRRGRNLQIQVPIFKSVSFKEVKIYSSDITGNNPAII